MDRAFRNGSLRDNLRYARLSPGNLHQFRKYLNALPCLGRSRGAAKHATLDTMENGSGAEEAECYVEAIMGYSIAPGASAVGFDILLLVGNIESPEVSTIEARNYFRRHT